MVGSSVRRLIASGICAGGLVTMGLAGPAVAQADPPGNNGTVKIDGEAFDDHPDNEPHVGCVFQVDFYGFDAGDLEATVLFEAIPPTAGDAVPPGAGTELLSDVVPIGEDAAGGGTDLDASRTYDLTAALAGIEPQAQQGWHVQLTVHAEGSQGADTKFKVFWVSGCGSTSTTSSSTTSSSVPGSTTTSTPGSTTTTLGGSTSSTTPGGSMPSTSAPGGVSPTGPTSPTTGGGGLPVTGSNSLPLLASGVGLVALGAALVAARRVRLRSAA
jgi:hypothetical protein